MCERLLTMIGRELGRTHSRHMRGRNMKVHAIRKVYSQVIYTFSSQAMWFLCFLVTQESGAVGLAHRICIALAFLFRTEAGSLLMNNLMNQILCHGPRKPKRLRTELLRFYAPPRSLPMLYHKSQYILPTEESFSFTDVHTLLLLFLLFLLHFQAKCHTRED